MAISSDPLYQTWHNIKHRCYDPRTDGYEYYGGRGIALCQEWLSSFESFKNGIGEKPSSRHQLNRINNDGNYEPGNVEWVLPYKNAAYNARRIRSDNKVGVPGVYYHKGKKRYHATITIHTRRIHLGWYASKAMAIKVRKSAEERFMGFIE